MSMQDKVKPREKREGSGPRGNIVKNRAPAEVQITAEQLLREAYERTEALVQPAKQQIGDIDELEEYRLRKRKEFEDNIRKNRALITNFIKYAQWEESQRDFRRARNVFERALDVDYRSVSLWLKYAEMEMKHGFVMHARNLWNRAVTLMPRVEQFWYKFAYMEEMLGNVAGARQIFVRWMEWEPGEQAWATYINMEMRYKEVDRARSIYDDFARIHPSPKSWLKFAKFEEKLGEIEKARAVYERGLNDLGDEGADEKFFVSFAKFEERHKEIERARVIYKYALDHIPKQKAPELYKMFVSFEKQYGDKEGIEDVIVGKRRFQYEEQIKANPRNFDVWFDYVRLEENNGDLEKTREVYERAIANVPPATEKRFWVRYIYLWVNYAVYEELTCKDFGRARQVYQACIKLIPHKQFSFSKIWIMLAQFELRQKNLAAARKVLGNAIGQAPSEKIFSRYIQLEYDLLNFDRCRQLYTKYLEFAPETCDAWIKFASFERSLGETDRARAIYELAVDQTMLDMPEVLWKAYIDFEIEEQENDRTAALFERLLERTKHVKVWLSFAQFSGTVDAERARGVYQRADEHFKGTEMKEERVMLLEHWRDYEQTQGDTEKVAEVSGKLPKKVKKRRMVKADDGTELGWEEYFDYIFPDEDAKRSNLKLLEMARKWKMGQA